LCFLFSGCSGNHTLAGNKVNLLLLMRLGFAVSNELF